MEPLITFPIVDSFTSTGLGPDGQWIEIVTIRKSKNGISMTVEDYSGINIYEYPSCRQVMIDGKINYL